MIRQALSLFLLFVAIDLPAMGREPARPPSVVLIVSDDQGFGDIGCYGATDVRTPVLDAMARNGARLTQFRVNPLCAPTRASLLTGQYSLECGMWRGPARRAGPDEDRALRSHVRLLPELLQEAGYVCGIFGKWHLGAEPPNAPNDRGFDEFYGFLGGAHPYHVQARGRGRLFHNRRPWRVEGHTTDLFTDQAIRFIREHQDRPFFCYVPYNAVHGPLASVTGDRPSAKAQWLRKYERLGVPMPRQDYCAVLGHMDECVGRILDTLRELGLEENTLVIFLSDNGAILDKFPGSNGPLRGGKGTTYEGGIRVPAIVQWTGTIPAAAVSSDNAAHFDIFSTILDAAGLPIPRRNGRHPVHGVSLLPHLVSGGQTPLPERQLFWDLFGKMAAIDGSWKLVGEIPNHHGNFAAALPRIAETRFELYNLADDPSETHDLAEEHPAVYEQLKQSYLRWFAQATQ